MEDEEIVGLFISRDENALRAVDEKYGLLLLSVAKKITCNDGDARECFDDALLNLWNNIPPAHPDNLRAYSCQVIRNVAFKRLTYSLSQKRNVNSAVALNELEAAMSDPRAEERLKDVDFKLFLEDFLRSLSAESRVVFMKRYFFADSVCEIANDLKMSESKVKSLLFRARKKLKKRILKE